MFNHSQSRKYTSAVLDAVSEGMLDKDSLIQDLLGYMSEADVKDFVRQNDLMPWLEDDEDEPDVDEATEWADFDPDC